MRNLSRHSGLDPNSFQLSIHRFLMWEESRARGKVLTRITALEQQRTLRRRQLEDIKVKACMSGILQLVPVERGQQVTPGSNLARVANPSNLKAELRIAETQTKDIRIGQYAEVDTRNVQSLR